MADEFGQLVFVCPICAQRITLHVTPSAPPICARGHRPRQMAREEVS